MIEKKQSEKNKMREREREKEGKEREGQIRSLKSKYGPSDD